MRRGGSPFWHGAMGWPAEERVGETAVKKLVGATGREIDNVDITNGRYFPWWLAIASSSKSKEIIADGMVRVEVGENDEEPFLIVTRKSGLSFVVKFDKKGGLSSVSRHAQ